MKYLIIWRLKSSAVLCCVCVCVCVCGLIGTDASENQTDFYLLGKKGKCKVIPLQAWFGPEGGYRYSFTRP